MVIVNESSLSSIGDAIRAKNGEKKYYNWTYSVNVDELGEDEYYKIPIPENIPQDGTIQVDAIFDLDESVHRRCRQKLDETTTTEIDILRPEGGLREDGKRYWRGWIDIGKDWNRYEPFIYFNIYQPTYPKHTYPISIEITSNFEGDIINPDTNYLPSEMADKIRGLKTFPDSILHLTGNIENSFREELNKWLFEGYSDLITTENITNASNLFYNNHYITEVPFEINGKEDGYLNLSEWVNGSHLAKLPYINGRPEALYSLLNGAGYLTEIPEDWADRIDWTYARNENRDHWIQGYYCLSSLFSLRRLPENLINNCWLLPSEGADWSCSMYTMSYRSMYVMDELVVPIVPMTSGMDGMKFYDSFYWDCRLKRLVFKDIGFEPEYWNDATLYLGSCIGYSGNKSDIVSFNSGLTEATEVTDQESYERLKDNPDYWTINRDYSRYNRLSAVETINSLPDITQWGNSNIIFEGNSGLLTDGGAINTMSEDEIAVAAAKGWTVQFN